MQNIFFFRYGTAVRLLRDTYRTTGMRPYFRYLQMYLVGSSGIGRKSAIAYL